MNDATSPGLDLGPTSPGASYRVLARKYRPATFADLIGQDAMVRTVSNAFESGRIPRNEEIVICVTGNGLKTQDAVFEAVEEPVTIKPSLAEFKALAGLNTPAAEPALV